MIELLQDEDWSVRRNATTAIGRIVPGIDVVPDLVKVLDDPSCSVRTAAAWALGEMAQAARGTTPSSANDATPSSADEPLPLVLTDAIPSIMKLLDDEDWQTRCRTALALGRFGKDAEIALPKFKEMRHEGKLTIIALDKAVAMMKGEYQGTDEEYDDLQYSDIAWYPYPG